MKIFKKILGWILLVCIISGTTLWAGDTFGWSIFLDAIWDLVKITFFVSAVYCLITVAILLIKEEI